MLGGLVSVLAGHLVQKVKLRAYAAALYAGAGASLLVAVVFALVALRHWIAVTYRSEYPDLWIALLFVLIAAICVGVGMFLASRKPKTNPAIDVALLAGPAVLGATARSVRRLSPRTVGVGVVLLTGLMAGRSLMKAFSGSADDA
jgi:hypothetical protein